MKAYVKPVILVNDELTEGVYAASGAASSDCWTVTVTKDQDDAGGYCTFRVAAQHSNSAQHISSKTVVTVVFDKVITNAEFEGFEASVSGNTATLTRESHANAYASGDNFNSLLKVWADEYKTLGVVSSGITCTHQTNVQGVYD